MIYIYNLVLKSASPIVPALFQMKIMWFGEEINVFGFILPNSSDCWYAAEIVTFTVFQWYQFNLVLKSVSTPVAALFPNKFTWVVDEINVFKIILHFSSCCVLGKVILSWCALEIVTFTVFQWYLYDPVLKLVSTPVTALLRMKLLFWWWNQRFHCFPCYLVVSLFKWYSCGIASFTFV